MREQECIREDELLEALQASRWPGVDTSLRQHVAGCASCTDMLAVVAPLLDERHALMQDATVPSSAVVWWRAQMRSRREAAQQAERPMSFVQGIALACAAGLLMTALGIFVPTFRRSVSWITDAAGWWSGLSVPVASDQLANPIVLAGIAAVGLCALLVPVALYFALKGVRS